jgi:hypothetical protein
MMTRGTKWMVVARDHTVTWGKPPTSAPGYEIFMRAAVPALVLWGRRLSGERIR